MKPSKVWALSFVPLVAANVAARANDEHVKVWAAIAYVHHGERTPVIGNLQTILTPEGAQQMVRQGEAFRRRYLEPETDATPNKSTALIHNISAAAIDNRQLSVLSRTEEWISGSALAFLQGLYPPKKDVFLDAAGGKDIAKDVIAGQNQTGYPLDGYQYPQIETLPLTDNRSVALDAITLCTAWRMESQLNLQNSKALVEQADSSRQFYANLLSTTPFKGLLPIGAAKFWQSPNTYDFVRYMYKHNETVSKGLKDANKTIETLQSHAYTYESAKNSDKDTNLKDGNNILHSIAGRTLAAHIGNHMSEFVKDSDSSPKLSLMFGKFEPLLAFFAIAGLNSRENISDGVFRHIPEPGAAIVFELVSERSDKNDKVPDPQNLGIRFYYRATADDDEEFEKYSLFGLDSEESTFAYTNFITQMQTLGKTAEDWCAICQPRKYVPWCPIDSSITSGDSHESENCSPRDAKISPAVAGVIGAVIMAVTVGLVSFGLYALGGFHVYRAGTRGRGITSSSFQGAEKMANDADVTVNRVGDRDERTGSWEMRDGVHSKAAANSAGIDTSRFDRRRLADDEMSLNGMPAAKVEESL